LSAISARPPLSHKRIQMTHHGQLVVYVYLDLA
jgi:hypothetical protein